VQGGTGTAALKSAPECLVSWRLLALPDPLKLKAALFHCFNVLGLNQSVGIPPKARSITFSSRYPTYLPNAHLFLCVRLTIIVPSPQFITATASPNPCSLAERTRTSQASSPNANCAVESTRSTFTTRASDRPVTA